MRKTPRLPGMVRLSPESWGMIYGVVVGGGLATVGMAGGDGFDSGDSEAGVLGESFGALVGLENDDPMVALPSLGCQIFVWCVRVKSTSVTTGLEFPRWYVKGGWKKHKSRFPRIYPKENCGAILSTTIFRISDINPAQLCRTHEFWTVLTVHRPHPDMAVLHFPPAPFTDATV